MSSANTFTSLLPALKESYPKKTEKRPGDKFKKLKDKLKKYNK